MSFMPNCWSRRRPSVCYFNDKTSRVVFCRIGFLVLFLHRLSTRDDDDWWAATDASNRFPGPTCLLPGPPTQTTSITTGEEATWRSNRCSAELPRCTILYNVYLHRPLDWQSVYAVTSESWMRHSLPSSKLQPAFLSTGATATHFASICLESC